MAAERGGDGAELGLQQGLGVAALLARAVRQHGGVAGQLLVEPGFARRQMDQRVEPAQALGKGDEAVDARVSTVDVGAFMSADQDALFRRVQRCGVGRHDDAGREKAGDRGAGEAAAGHGQEPQLPERDHGRAEQRAGQPEAQQRRGRGLHQPP